MSGKPDPESVAEVRKSLIREAEIEDRLHKIEAEVQVLATERSSLYDELGAIRTKRWEAMKAMDVTSSGNFGHEQRMTVFLMELVSPFGVIGA